MIEQNTQAELFFLQNFALGRNSVTELVDVLMTDVLMTEGNSGNIVPEFIVV
jgi:hypothetical protein